MSALHLQIYKSKLVNDNLNFGQHSRLKSKQSLILVQFRFGLQKHLFFFQVFNGEVQDTSCCQFKFPIGSC